MTGPLMRGVVWSYSERKNFGFLVEDSGPEQIFFRSNSVTGRPRVGAAVSFMVRESSSKKGALEAFAVTVLD
jgi:cold shock CspA family protein